jgi:ParB/RepB/Spo0J family partition protein
MPTARTHMQEFDPARVRPLPDQPRKRFRGIRELADSILEAGQLSPGIVTRVDGDPDFDAQLIDGERRLRACKLAGVPFRAEVRPDTAAEETFVASFAANFGKQDHDCVEIAEGLARMQAAGKTYEQMARIAGRSVCWVSQHLSLLKLHPDVRALLVAEGEDDTPRLAYSVALTLAGLPHDRQLALTGKITGAEGMSLVAVQRLVVKERAAAGDKDAYKQNNGSKRTISSIDAYLEHFSNRIGIFFDMPHDKRTEAIDAVDHRQKRLTAEALEEMADNLKGFAAEIRRRLPTAGVRKSA